MYKLLSALLAISVYCHADVEYNILPLKDAENSFDLSFIRPPAGPNANGQYVTPAEQSFFHTLTINDPNAEPINLNLKTGTGKTAISDNGKYVGFTMTSNEAFTWNAKTGFRHIKGEAEYGKSKLIAVNNKGDVVFQNLIPTHANAKKWTTIFQTIDGKNFMTDKIDIWASSIEGANLNDNRQVVGHYVDYRYGVHGFIWDEKNGIRDLKDLIPSDSGWSELREGKFINNDGLIVGKGIFNGEETDFLLIPVDYNAK